MILLLLVSGLLMVPGYAQSGQQKSAGNFSPSDQNFLKQAAEGNLAEVQLGQLGQQKGTAPEVKQLAQTLATDHQQNQQKLQSLAQKEGVTLPTAPLPKDKAATDRLSKLSGAVFDKAFAHHAVMEHEKDIAQFKHEESMTKNSDVKSYAGETLPKLQQHLQLAQTAAQKTGTGAAKQ
jgi:putative membrane protein